LHALDGGPDIVLDRSPLLVGRHPECDARIDSVMISRHHCTISADGGEIVIRDLGSTNGTWINDRRVDSARLRPGDRVSIAHLRFIVE
jgi:pSer/pThr/pTyr-binding forkhead associated (FHA) protein